MALITSTPEMNKLTTREVDTLKLGEFNTALTSRTDATTHDNTITTLATNSTSALR